MINVNKPINLEQLDKELNGKGLNARHNSERQIIAVGLADGNNATEIELQEAINLHQAVFPEVSVADKLASVGLNLEDLKTALGLA
jgi:hypothetical protein